MPQQDRRITVRPLLREDRPQWEVLWQGYVTFYEASVPAQTTEETWQRLLSEAWPNMVGLGATDKGKLVGFTHLIFHPSTWSQSGYCYLEDLFTDPEARGLGAASALIEESAAIARKAGAGRLYWSTQETNARARALYDRLAKRSGFIQYRKPL